jgi:hypothetical protein
LTTLVHFLYVTESISRDVAQGKRKLAKRNPR